MSRANLIAQLRRQLAVAEQDVADLRAALEALEKRELTDTKRLATVEPVTHAQEHRRASSIAQTAAKNSDDAFLLAISRSKKWRSQTHYAKSLRISAASLSQYRKGATETPPWVVDRAESDLGVPRSYWTSDGRKIARF